MLLLSINASKVSNLISSSDGSASSDLQYARQVSAFGVPGSDIKILIPILSSALSATNLAKYSSADLVMLIIYDIMRSCG